MKKIRETHLVFSRSEIMMWRGGKPKFDQDEVFDDDVNANLGEHGDAVIDQGGPEETGSTRRAPEWSR